MKSKIQNLNFLRCRHSWHGFIENGPRQNIAQLWKLFSYIPIRGFRKFLSGIVFFLIVFK